MDKFINLLKNWIKGEWMQYQVKIRSNLLISFIAKKKKKILIKFI